MDRIIGIVALLVLIAFTGVLLVFVPDIDLAVVVVVVALLAAYDFYLMLFKEGGNGR